jgi:hypothetical protein
VGLAACSSWPASSREPEPAAPAQEPQEELVSPVLEARMTSAAAEIEERGFARAGAPFRAFLVERNSMVQSVALPSGRCQVFVALGSTALQAIELGVFESGGTEVASARGTTSAALRYCPTLPGVHYVAIQARSGDGLIVARRFEGPNGIEIQLDELFPVDPTPNAETVVP